MDDRMVPSTAEVFWSNAGLQRKRGNYILGGVGVALLPVFAYLTSGVLGWLPVAGWLENQMIWLGPVSLLLGGTVAFAYGPMRMRREAAMAISHATAISHAERHWGPNRLPRSLRRRGDPVLDHPGAEYYSVMPPILALVVLLSFALLGCAALVWYLVAPGEDSGVALAWSAILIVLITVALYAFTRAPSAWAVVAPNGIHHKGHTVLWEEVGLDGRAPWRVDPPPAGAATALNLGLFATMYESPRVHITSDAPRPCDVAVQVALRRRGVSVLRRMRVAWNLWLEARGTGE